MSQEEMIKDGIIYVREPKYTNFYTCSDAVCRHGVGSSDVIRQDLGDRPHVLCQCGCESFTLRYGDYEIFARCTQCGKESSVYSG